MPSKAAQARSLGISRQALYYKPRREGKDEALRDEILTILEQFPFYGHKKLHDHFKNLGRRVNKKRLRRVMKRFGVAPRMRQRKFVKTTDEFTVSEVPNRIRNVCPTQPDVFWAGDFTYIWFRGRYIYLATVIDLFTREIIAWQIGLHHTTRLILDVLEEAYQKRGGPKIFHSDQGSEYASQECISWLVRRDILPSHSPKGKPWHNGTQESFYNSFKFEFMDAGGVKHSRTIEELIERIGKYLHFYNTMRIHGALHMPPRAFHDRRKWKK